MTLKAVLAAVAAAAIVIGFALPSPHAGHAEAHSQFQTLDLKH